MCNPVILAGIGLSIGSAVANSVAISKANKARDDVLAAERIRQRQYDAEAGGVNQHSLGLYKDVGAQQAAKSSQLAAYFGANSDPGAANTAAASVMPTSTSNVTTSEAAKQSSLANAFVGQQAGALADLRSFGEMLGDNSRSQARDASLIGQIGGFKKGSSAVVPYELDHASHAGDGWKTAGDILGGLGSLTSMYGLTSGVSGGAAKVASEGLSGMSAAKYADFASMPGYTSLSTVGKKPALSLFSWF